MPPVRVFLLALATCLPAAALAAQGAATGQSGRRRLLPRAEEVVLARSAAPAGVSDSATIYMLTDSGWQVAVRGSNGVHCHVNHTWVESLEPHCFDAEAAATIMPIEMRRTELLHAGRSLEEARADIARGLAEGRFRVPARPAMSYMMSAAQRLISDDGRPAGKWRPHLMIYYPYLTSADLGLGANQDPRSAILVDPGLPTANIMIIVRDFVEPQAATGP